MRHSERMTRAAAKLVFAALLALFSAHSAVPSSRVVAAAEVVWCCRAEQRTVEEARSAPAVARREPTQPACRSPYVAEPDAAVLFQRPPPNPSLPV